MSLLILADGHLLFNLNRQHKKDYGSLFIDVNTIPGLVAEKYGHDIPPREKCHFFMVGAGNASSFIENIEKTWSIEQFAKNAVMIDDKEHCSMSTILSWALGTAFAHKDSHEIVCVTNDRLMVQPIRFSLDQGVNVSMAWPRMLPSDTNYFASMMNVPFKVLEETPSFVGRASHFVKSLKVGGDES